ncbi:MAG: hypothetical protein NZ772_18880 [Cyanobacteria bacterium]|nr:hypothetical protein [Cyanobacteriota bacterium]
MKPQFQKFACPIARYRGIKDPLSQEFNSHLQVFAHRLSLLVGLHTGGKLSNQQIYPQLLTLWDELQPYLSLVADDTQTPKPNQTTMDALLARDSLASDRLSSFLDAD